LSALGAGFRVQGLEYTVSGRVWGVRFSGQGAGFMDQGLGHTVSDPPSRVPNRTLHPAGNVAGTCGILARQTL